MKTNQEVPVTQDKQLLTAWERFLAERGLQATGEVVLNSNNTELEDASEGGPYLWLWYPAQVEMLVQTYRKLLKAAGAKNMDIGVVEYIRGARQPGTDLVMLYPTTKVDADRIELQDNNNHKWGNLRTLLEPTKRLAPKGRKVRYEVTYLEDSPVGPCIVFDQSQKLETRLINPKKAEAAAPTPTTTTPTTTPTTATAPQTQPQPALSPTSEHQGTEVKA